MGKANLNTKRDRAELYLGDFMNLVYKEIKGKDVLDVGSAGHDLGTGIHRYRPGKLFSDMSVYAEKITGLDNYEVKVKLLRKRGVNIYYGNAENFNIKRGGFEVVTALAIIEHLNNPGLFLRNSAGQLKPGGRLVLFTINAFSIRSAARALLNGWVPVNSEHSAYYDMKTLTQLVERNGFRVLKVFYVFGGRFNVSEYLERLAARYIRKIYAPNIMIICEAKTIIRRK